METSFFDEPLVLFFVGASLGLVLGSFVTMLSYRLPRGLSIVKPRSACPLCKATLGPRDLIPVVSWFLNKKKCRYCEAPISIRYPLIEIITATLTVFTFMFIGLHITLIPALLLIVSIMTAATMQMEIE